MARKNSKTQCSNKSEYFEYVIESKSCDGGLRVSAEFIKKLVIKAKKLDKKPMFILGIKDNDTLYTLKCEIETSKIHV